MNKKQKLAIVILSLFVIGMCIGAADAAHTVTKGKNKVKLTNKEYKKLTAEKTQYKTVTKTKKVTKYKNVTKTRTVTKTKEVNKTRQVNKTKVESESVNTARLYQDYVYDEESGKIVLDREANRTMNQDKVQSLEKNGYEKNGVQIIDHRPNGINDYWDYVDENGQVFQYAGYFESEYTTYTKSSTYLEDENYTDYEPYNITEKYTVKEPYKVTEKYKVKVPYKVRKDATITKRVPKKFDYYKVAIPVYKKYKVAYTVKKWKYLGKSAIFGIQSPKERQYTKNKAKKLKKNGWKINKNKHKSDYDFIEGSYKHYYLCSKKCYRTEKRIVKYKYKKVKTPLMMTISSYKGLKKGKVFCELWSEAGIKSAGNGKIK